MLWWLKSDLAMVVEIQMLEGPRVADQKGSL